MKGRRVVTCVDGDPCDVDWKHNFPTGGQPACGNNACAIEVAICVGQTVPELPACTPARLQDFHFGVRRLGMPGGDFEPDYVPRKSLLATALPPTWNYGPSCGNPISMDVVGRVTRDGRTRPGRLEISLDAVAAGGTSPANDDDRIVLVCQPRTTPCPDSPPSTTTTTLPPVSTAPTVIVGAGGGIRFEPDTVRIRAGDTVRWFWEGGGYVVGSGTPFQPDGLFCWPKDERFQFCPSSRGVRSGTTYEHTFPEPGTFEYFNDNGFPMRGRVIVEP